MDPTPADPATSVTMTHSFVAQLPTVGVVSLPPPSLDTSVGVDVGPLLTQVHHLGVFKAGHLAVSGSRKVAAVVSSSCYHVERGSGDVLTRDITPHKY